MMGFGLLMLNCECWVLDRISRQSTGLPGRARPAPSRWDSREALRAGDASARSGTDGGFPSKGAIMSQDSTDRPLPRVADHRSGGPGRPGTDQRRPSGPRCGDPLSRSRCTSATGSASDRPVHRGAHRAVPDHRLPQPGLREPQASRAEAPPLDQLLATWAEPAPHARRSACRPAAGPRSSRQTRVFEIPAGEHACDRITRLGYSGKANWSNMSASGTISSEKASWRTTFGACRSPVGAATAGRRGAHR